MFLKVRVPGERHYREIPFGRQSYLELREEIAFKFDCKPVQVLQVFKVGWSKLKPVLKAPGCTRSA